LPYDAQAVCEEAGAAGQRRMGWRRLPTYLVNFPLRLMPLTPKQRQALETTGHVSEVAFKTIPSVGKVRAAPGSRCPPP
jgi:hypothetical protein